MAAILCRSERTGAQEMANPSTKYAPEYRMETADCIISTGRPAAEVAREVGVDGKTAARWVRQRRARLDREAGKTVADSADPEVRAMQRRIRELEMENESLKKPRPSSPGTTRSRQVPADAGGEGRLSRRDDGKGSGSVRVGLLLAALQRLPRQRRLGPRGRRREGLARARPKDGRAPDPAADGGRRHPAQGARMHAQAGHQRCPPRRQEAHHHPRQGCAVKA